MPVLTLAAGAEREPPPCSPQHALPATRDGRGQLVPEPAVEGPDDMGGRQAVAASRGAGDLGPLGGADEAQDLEGTLGQYPLHGEGKRKVMFWSRCLAAAAVMCRYLALLLASAMVRDDVKGDLNRPPLAMLLGRGPGRACVYRNINARLADGRAEINK